MKIEYEYVCINCGNVFKAEGVVLKCPKCDSINIDVNMRGV